LLLLPFLLLLLLLLLATSAKPGLNAFVQIYITHTPQLPAQKSFLEFGVKVIYVSCGMHCSCFRQKRRCNKYQAHVKLSLSIMPLNESVEHKASNQLHITVRGRIVDLQFETKNKLVGQHSLVTDLGSK